MEEERKSKFGRKPLGKSKKRDRRHKVSFTEAEEKVLMDIFKNTGKTQFNVFLRQLILEKAKQTTFVPEVNIEYRTEIKRIGVNLNQIARQVNTHFGSVSSGEILNEIELLKDFLRKVLQTTNGK